MTQERLSSLALMHIHYDTDIDLEEVVDVFAKKHPRKLELTTVLRDQQTDSGGFKDGAYFCYCAHLLRITQGIDRTRRAR